MITIKASGPIPPIRCRKESQQGIGPMRADQGKVAPRDPGPMGPRPDRSVAALAGLGLSEEEIARYFGVRRDRVRRAAPAVVAPRRGGTGRQVQDPAP